MSQSTDLSHLDRTFTFDLETLFSDVSAFDAKILDAQNMIAGLGTLHPDPAVSASNLHAWLQHGAELEITVDQIHLYAFLRHEVNHNDQEGTNLLSRALELLRQSQAALAPIEKSFASVSEEHFTELSQQQPELTAWRHDHLMRRRRARHLLDPRLAGLSAELDTMASHSENMDQVLASELRFDPIIDETNTLQALTIENLNDYLRNPNQQVRNVTQQSYLSARYRHRQSSANFWQQFISTRVAKARLRNYESNLEEAFDEANIPTGVFHATLEACRRNSSIWNRYWNARRQLLGFATLTTADLWIPLEHVEPSIPYQQAVEWIVDAVRPLGDDYADILHRGLTVDRWVDVYPDHGKTQGAFCWTTDGCKPYILVSYQNNFSSLSSLAHESGHAMHSYYTHATQPHQYANYGRAAAETAANVHQALLFSYLRDKVSDPAIRRAALQTELKVCKQYLMQMPINAIFEHQAYTKVWSGKHLDADELCSNYLELARMINGSSLSFSELDSIEWVEESALYTCYGALQYTFGIIGGQSVAERILRDESDAAKRYRHFLTMGNSIDQLESLEVAGINFWNGQAIDQTFIRVSELVSEMELLIR